jgi:anti-sigma factor RsiW
MCDERERLLDYLYDACEADERRAVERHLEACDDCRREISELRAVRLDLLAWDVPEHGSVWKPFAPARVTPWYREIPAWALAAAASVMFVLGLAGGVVSRALVPAASLTVAPAPFLAPEPAEAANVATPLDLAAMEQRILSAVQARMEEQLRPVAAHVQAAGPAIDREELLREVQALVAQSEDRQRQALNASMLSWLQDSQQTFVTNRDFNTFRREELSPMLRLVGFQQGSGQ